MFFCRLYYKQYEPDKGAVRSGLIVFASMMKVVENVFKYDTKMLYINACIPSDYIVNWTMT